MPQEKTFGRYRPHMNSTSAWTTPLIALGGVLLTLLVTVWMDYRKARRETRFQWTAQLLELYRDFLAASNDLRQAPVWPTPPDSPPQPVDPLVERLRAVSAEARLLAHRDVTDRMAATVTTAETLRDTVTAIRTSTEPGHSGAIDQRRRPEYDTARASFSAAVEDFLTAARADIDLRSPFSRTSQPS